MTKLSRAERRKRADARRAHMKVEMLDILRKHFYALLNTYSTKAAFSTALDNLGEIVISKMKIYPREAHMWKQAFREFMIEMSEVIKDEA